MIGRLYFMKEYLLHTMTIVCLCFLIDGECGECLDGCLIDGFVA